MAVALPKLYHAFVFKAPAYRVKRPERFAWDMERGCLVYAKSGRKVGPKSLRRSRA